MLIILCNFKLISELFSPSLEFDGDGCRLSNITLVSHVDQGFKPWSRHDCVAILDPEQIVVN